MMLAMANSAKENEIQPIVLGPSSEVTDKGL